MKDDRFYMNKAIDLAKKGAGCVNPNPLVGALIVKDDLILGEGFHQVYGGPHAEVNAFNDVKQRIDGATMYVTLEPCYHYGKTPPCVDAIIKHNIKRVVIASLDPNPLVAGKSVQKLKDVGIEVVVGVEKEQADALNAVFFHYIKTKTPYLIMKYAMTADGKIATHTGKSKWITGSIARGRVHKDRNLYSAIMVGVGTIIADDPMLDCRLEKGRNPIRIICDTNLTTPLSSRVVHSANEITTLIATATTDKTKQAPYLEKGIHIIDVNRKNNRLDLGDLMIKLGERHIDSIYLEGGATLNASALEAGIVNKVHTYIGPKLFGGTQAKSPIGGVGVTTPENAYQLENQKITIFDEDILIEYDVKNIKSK